MLPTEDFSALERAVLDMVKELYHDSVLSEQIDAASFERRKWTEVGYYTYLKVPPLVPKLNCKFPINGPWLDETVDMEHGGRAVIWGKDGYITTIEMWANGRFSEDPIHFKLYVDKTDRFEIERPTTSSNH